MVKRREGARVVFRVIMRERTRLEAKEAHRHTEQRYAHGQIAPRSMPPAQEMDDNAAFEALAKWVAEGAVLGAGSHGKDNTIAEGRGKGGGIVPGECVCDGGIVPGERAHTRAGMHIHESGLAGA